MHSWARADLKYIAATISWLLALMPSAPAFEQQSLQNVLNRSHCIGCNLAGANLEGADLSGLNLSWSDLSWANLRNANLRDAIIDQTIFEGANLSGTIWIHGIRCREGSIGGCQF